MPTSYSTGNHLHLLSLGARAARSYAAELPKEALQAATRIEGMFDELRELNARQEKAKQQLAMLTRELKAKKQESMKERARLIRLAEATFGPRDPRIKEFRPATEGKVRTARGEGARRKAERADREPRESAQIVPPGMEPTRRAVVEVPSLPPPRPRLPAHEQGGGGPPNRRTESRPPAGRTYEPVPPQRPAVPSPQFPRRGGSEAYRGLGDLAPLRAEAWAHPPLPLVPRDPTWGAWGRF